LPPTDFDPPKAGKAGVLLQGRLQGAARVLAAIRSNLLRAELYLRFIAESCCFTKLSLVSKTPKTEQAGTRMGGYRRNLLSHAKTDVVAN